MAKNIAQGALLIGIAVVLQSLRLIIPLPLQASTFIIGTLIHMMLTLTIKLNGLTTAIVLSCILPMFAYAQGQLMLPLLIPVVILGNTIFVILLKQFNQSWQQFLAPIAKALVMGISAHILISFIQLPKPQMAKLLLFAMTVPQIITGIAGILLAKTVQKRLKI